MEARLDGKIALVTGATQGIGQAVAEALADAGVAGLLLTGRDQARGDAVAKSLSANGLPVLFVAADLADAATPEKLATACIGRFRRIDILVNAAGLTDRASVAEATFEDWSRLFDVNARAPFFLMQHAIRAMKSAGKGGAIVNILSINAHCGAPDLGVYSASKGALATATRNAANAHRFDRIRVNGINVGWADTPAERTMQATTLGKGAGWIEEAGKTLPFGRLISAAEVASLAVFLASEASGVMTGAIIDQEQWVVGANR